MDPPEEQGGIPINPQNSPQDDAAAANPKDSEKRARRAPQRYAGYVEQNKMFESKEKEEAAAEKARKKAEKKAEKKAAAGQDGQRADAATQREKSSFAKLFGELGIQDWSFLTKKVLTDAEAENKRKLYDFFNLTADATDGKQKRNALLLEQSYNVYVSVMLWRYFQQQKGKFNEAKHFVAGMDEFVKYFLSQETPENVSIVQKYLDKSTTYRRSSNT